MRLHPGCLLVALSLLLLPLGGCYYVAAAAGMGAAVGAATTPAPAPAGSSPWLPGASLSIQFGTPRDVVAGVPGGRDSLHLRAVTRIVGKVRRVYGDTIMVSLTEVRRGTGAPLSFAAQREPVALVLPGQDTRVQMFVGPSPAARGIIGALAGMVLAVVGILGSCVATRCLD
jgi:hypothetical protein